MSVLNLINSHKLVNILSSFNFITILNETGSSYAVRKIEVWLEF